MKKAFSLLLSLALMATLTACSTGGSSSGSSAAAGHPNGIDPLATATQENLPTLTLQSGDNATATALVRLLSPQPEEEAAPYLPLHPGGLCGRHPRGR